MKGQHAPLLVSAITKHSDWDKNEKAKLAHSVQQHLEDLQFKFMLLIMRYPTIFLGLSRGTQDGAILWHGICYEFEVVVALSTI